MLLGRVASVDRDGVRRRAFADDVQRAPARGDATLRATCFEPGE